MRMPFITFLICMSLNVWAGSGSASEMLRRQAVVPANDACLANPAALQAVIPYLPIRDFLRLRRVNHSIQDSIGRDILKQELREIYPERSNAVQQLEWANARIKTIIGKKRKRPDLYEALLKATKNKLLPSRVNFQKTSLSKEEIEYLLSNWPDIWQVTYGCGAVYRGDFHRGRSEGRGKKCYASGNTYEGQWQNGEPHGQGTGTDNLGQRYKGQWQNGELHGPGKWTTRKGEKYKEKWRHGRLVSSRKRRNPKPSSGTPPLGSPDSRAS